MKTPRLWTFSLVALTLLFGSCAEAPPADASESLYFGIEINGTLCGYSRIEISPVVGESGLLHLRQEMFLMLSALGSEFNAEVDLDYHVDPATGRFTYHASDVRQGRMHLDSEYRVEGNVARLTSSLASEEKVIPLTDETVLPNTLFFPHLTADFVGTDLAEKTYSVLEVREGKIQETTFTRVGAETLEVLGEARETLVLATLNKSTGLKSKLWIDTATGRLHQAEHPAGRMIRRTDASVVKRIRLARLDETLVKKVDVRIGDVQGITRMKVKATLEPSGAWITPESLNVPGQRFAGTVVENRIEGVFEVAHARYDGVGAPPFPHVHADEAFAEYLTPDDYIESADPVLVAEAKRITQGSKNSWDAAVRLSRWVASNIDYAIPGGGLPRKTYDIRAGECGAHSLLLATFCRAVGIPARAVWGCMYIPNHGGAFGQHAWSEIYMGEAGWIPVDATAMETDFADSGHIRLGELSSAGISLNPIATEVLEHEVRGGQKPPAVGDEEYAAYTGDYTGKRRRVMKVVEQDGGLGVVVPGGTLLLLEEPDEEGRRYARMTKRIYCTFARDAAGKVNELCIHEVIRLQKLASPDEIDEGVPEDQRRYLGTYLLAQRNVEFTVIWRKGNLAVKDPMAKKTIRLAAPDARGRRLDEYGKNTMSFEEEDGRVVRMLIDVPARFRR